MCLWYLKSEEMSAVFLFALCTVENRGNVLIKRKNTEFNFLLCLTAPLDSTEKWNAFLVLTKTHWRGPPFMNVPYPPCARHPTLSCPCRTWHPRPPLWWKLTEPQSQQRQCPCPKAELSTIFGRKCSMSYEGTEPFGSYLDPFCLGGWTDGWVCVFVLCSH